MNKKILLSIIVITIIVPVINLQNNTEASERFELKTVHMYPGHVFNYHFGHEGENLERVEINVLGETTIVVNLFDSLIVASIYNTKMAFEAVVTGFQTIRFENVGPIEVDIEFTADRVLEESTNWILIFIIIISGSILLFFIIRTQKNRKSQNRNRNNSKSGKYTHSRTNLNSEQTNQRENAINVYCSGCGEKTEIDMAYCEYCGFKL